MPKEVDFKQLADVPNIQDYQKQPIQNFGMNMLKMMGYSKQRGIGKNQKNALLQPVVLKPRPKGLGLGAQQENQQKIPQFKKGEPVLIIKGAHKDLTGMIIEVKQKECTIQLRKSGSIIKQQFENLKKLSYTQLLSFQQNRNNNEQKKKKTLKWVIPSIRVKITNKQSKYYLKKVIINEILSERQFQCLYTNENSQNIYLKQIRQKDIQTVIPKQGGSVIILKGQFKGQKGKVIQRDKKKEKVIIQTQNELQLLTLNEDDICEYVQI